MKNETCIKLFVFNKKVANLFLKNINNFLIKENLMAVGYSLSFWPQFLSRTVSTGEAYRYSASSETNP